LLDPASGWARAGTRLRRARAETRERRERLRYGGWARGRARALVSARPARERDQVSRGDTGVRVPRTWHHMTQINSVPVIPLSARRTVSVTCTVTRQICDTLWSVCRQRTLALNFRFDNRHYLLSILSSNGLVPDRIYPLSILSILSSHTHFLEHHVQRFTRHGLCSCDSLDPARSPCTLLINGQLGTA
jgi:hypothetical protein